MKQLPCPDFSAYDDANLFRAIQTQAETPPEGSKSQAEWAKLWGFSGNIAGEKLRKLCDLGAMQRKRVRLGGNTTAFFYWRVKQPKRVNKR